MLFKTTCYLISVNFLIADVLTFQTNSNESCVRLYEKGVEAYLDNDYQECVENFEEAVQKYQLYKKVTNNCRLKCKQEADTSDPLFRVDVENLLFYERAIKNTLCIMHCKTENADVFNGTQMNFETEQLFEDQKPYEYLHICYFQTKEYQKAASAAFTYLVTHPNDKAMQGNLKHYTQVEGVKSDDIVNFEAKSFVYLYAHGADAYNKKDWKNVEHNMEESLGLYLQAEEECRAGCEGPFDHGWYPDFIPSIANHFTMVLKCKMDCSEKLNTLNGEEHDDLLPSHYHYLQYAYFKMGNIKEACQAVASYLLFFPDDETMLDNMKYYRSLPKVDNEDFRPREEAVKYVQRKIYENKIMNFVNHEYRNIGVTQIDEEENNSQSGSESVNTA
ncbi:unnamed protein product [Brassicogethes aeneus]|uniref:Leprecan-like alpha-helical domain-containing protein n=1 Tax=Brassicogethes aeneus TaxID=1431903 RepID=A0A9P0FP47_BRAAE|nr:unnamed protein product [Brassicogethes aeneus]